jgi:AmmeMemoRadiSam system protein A
VQLAWQSVESWVLYNRVMGTPEDLPEALTGQRAGAFVSIHRQGRLRGCIGTISACCSCIAEEIIQNAVSACSRDYRFHKVTAGELPLLEYSVDILGEAEDIAGPDQLDVKRYGVIVSCGRKRGLLLPDLEGVDTVGEQIRIASAKAGISEEYDRNIRLQRFEVIRHT